MIQLIQVLRERFCSRFMIHFSLAMANIAGNAYILYIYICILRFVAIDFIFGGALDVGVYLDVRLGIFPTDEFLRGAFMSEIRPKGLEFPANLSKKKSPPRHTLRQR